MNIEIEGVIIRQLKKRVDERGWLAELFRIDELEEKIYPVMSYISMTMPGVTRGPHEHRKQYDNFCFIGPSNFKLYLWDNRKDSPTYKNNTIVYVGEDNPVSVVVPPGVVHAYKNIGIKPGIVINFPNKLYAGWKRQEKVDEIRYENDPKSEFRVE